MEFKQDGYCGLFCGACPVMIANQKGEVDALAARLDMPAEDVVCFGCKGNRTASFCTGCKIRTCTQERGFDFCFRCDELPCEPYVDFRDDERYPYHLATPANLERIASIGVAAWLEEQDARWRCPECGERFAWRDETCSQCGGVVPNYRADLA